METKNVTGSFLSWFNLGFHIFFGTRVHTMAGENPSSNLLAFLASVCAESLRSFPRLHSQTLIYISISLADADAYNVWKGRVTKNKRYGTPANQCVVFVIFRVPVRLVLKQSLDRLITTCVKVPDARGILYISSSPVYPHACFLFECVCICAYGCSVHVLRRESGSGKKLADFPP